MKFNPCTGALIRFSLTHLMQLRLDMNYNYAIND